MEDRYMQFALVDNYGVACFSAVQPQHLRYHNDVTVFYLWTDYKTLALHAEQNLRRGCSTLKITSQLYENIAPKATDNWWNNEYIVIKFGKTVA